MKTLILGAGLSAVSAARFLSNRDQSVLLSNPKPLARELADDLCLVGVKLLSGPQDRGLLEKTQPDRIVISPGIPPQHKVVLAAQDIGIPITTDVAIANDAFAGLQIGVTGTNGKSTTVAMVAFLFNQFGLDSIACGNIGKPPLDLLAANPKVLVYELSSYQLHYSPQLQLDAAIFLSFSQDHIQWHGDNTAYLGAKCRIFNCNPKFQLAHPEVLTHIQKLSDLEQPSQPETMPKPNSFVSTLITSHDQMNAWAAAWCANRLLNKNFDESFAALKNFKTLEHRFECFAHVKGYQIINDSKATNVDALTRALDNVDQNVTVLIGGRGKGESFVPVRRFAGKVKKVLTFGEEAPKIFRQLHGDFPISSYDRLEDALAALDLNALEGPLLLAPGCASFDGFENFEKRGEFFKNFINDKLMYGTK